MAKNVEINIKTDSGYEVLYPRVSGNNSDISTDISSQFGLDEKSSIGDVLSKIGNTGVFSGYTEKMENDFGDVWNNASYSITEYDDGQKQKTYYLGQCEDKLVFYKKFQVYDSTMNDGDGGYKNNALVISLYDLETKTHKAQKLTFTDAELTASGTALYLNYPQYLYANNKILIFISNGAWIVNPEDLSFSVSPYKTNEYGLSLYSRAVYFKGIYGCYTDKKIVYSNDLVNWTVATASISGRYGFMTACGDYLYFIDTVSSSSYATLYRCDSADLKGEIISKGTLQANYSISNMSEANGLLFIATYQSNSYYVNIYNPQTEKLVSGTYTLSGSTGAALKRVFYADGWYYGATGENTVGSDESGGVYLVKWQNTVFNNMVSDINKATVLSNMGGFLDVDFNATLNTLYYYTYSTSTLYYTQRTYIKDYNLTNALSEILTLGDSYRKVELTSYIGNGKYGSSNPTSVIFSFNPKMVVVTQKSNIGCSILLKGATIGSVLPQTSSNYFWRSVTWIKNGVQWYANAVNGQYNESGGIYLVIGIG